MVEYIERDQAVRKAIDAHIKVVGHGISQVDAVDIADEIDSIPTADVVEVVRCKDCIHYYELEPVCLKIYSDGNVSADAWQERKPDDFCSYGEAKMDGGNKDG